MARLIQQTFEAVVMTQLFPRTQIDIFVQILQSDGGTLRLALLPGCVLIVHLPACTCVCVCLFVCRAIGCVHQRHHTGAH